MRRLLLAALLLAGTAHGQWQKASMGWVRVDGYVPGATSVPGGGTTQVQYNDGGVLNGSSAFTFQKATGALSGTGPWTLTPVGDFAPLTVRAYSSGTSPIIQWQTSANGALGNVAHDGTVTAPQFRVSALNSAPATAASTGTAGEVRITSTGIYICVATDTWIKAAAATW